MSTVVDPTASSSRPRGALGPDGAIAALRTLLPETAVLDDAAVLVGRSRDESSMPGGAPLVLVRPRTTAEVSTAVRVAHEHGLPVVPQGALTGLAGGANAVDGALILDLSRMDAVLRVDPVDQIAVVQPGVVTDDLARAVASHGLFYPPDPASSDLCTIGGNVATNAGGMRCVKYGVTRDFVRSLEVVLADGRVIRTRAATVKAVAGLDLTGLFIGSEGTLGVITEVTVALIPAPGPTLGVSAAFARVEDALGAANDIMATPRRPSTLELLDGVVLDAIMRYDPAAGLPVAAGAWLLALTDARVGAEEDLTAYTDIFRQHAALTVDVASDPAHLDALLSARRTFNPALRALRGGSLNEDISVPRARLGELLARLTELSTEVGLPIGAGGHVGDGNLHPVIVYDPDDPHQEMVARRAHGRVMALASELGGTVTGEHGIGTEKLGALDAELGPTVRELQRALKNALDPQGILNPGKKL
jgi:glycolate oxidase